MPGHGVAAGVKACWRKIGAAVWLILMSTTICAAFPQHRWIVRLADGHTTRSPVAPLRFHLPGDMPQSVRAALIYKLDGVDVTDAVTISPDDAVFVPPEPLISGRHRLVLIHAPPNGRWRELGVWGFSVVDSPASEGKPATDPAHFLQTSVGDSARLDVKFTPTIAPRTPSSGIAAPPDPTVMPYYRKSPQPAVEDITAVLSSDDVAVQLGKQKLAYESFIHKDRERSGTAANWSLGDATRVLGFGMRSSAQTRLNGVVMEHRWSMPGDDQIGLAGGWISASALAADGARAGSAWSVAGDASLLARRLRLRLEHAASRSDQDTARDAPNASGMANKVAMELHARDQAAVGWHLGVEQSRVTPVFVSLANPGLATDRLSLRTYGDLHAGAWRFQWSVERWRNNLEQDKHIATVQSGKTQLAASWAPANLFGIGFFGRPTYKLAADFGSVREVAAPAILDHTSPDNRSVDLTMQTEFVRGDWLWGVRAKRGELHRIADTGAPSRSIALDLYGDFTAMRRFPIKPTLSWQRKHKQTTGVVSEKWLAKVTSTTIELHEDLRAHVNMGLARWIQSGLAENADAVLFGGSMVWTLQRPHTDRTGLTLSLSGSYRDGDALPAPAAGEDDFRLMLSLSTTNPLDDW